MGSGWLDRWRRIRRVVRLWVATDLSIFGGLSKEELKLFHAEYLQATADLSREEREIANQVYQNVRRDNRP